MPASKPTTESGDESRDQSDAASPEFAFDGTEGRARTLGSDQPCGECGEPFHEHDRERVNEASGRWSYNYVC